MRHYTIPQILQSATNVLSQLDGQVVDLVSVERPTSLQYALELTKIISKLSPLLGNLFEFRIVDKLNSSNKLGIGRWVRQDPGFPDARYISDEYPIDNIGVEIKAWFPLATEITGRFKDSEDIFENDSINVAIVVWLPEYIFWGKPQIIKTLIVSGKSIAIARDAHYHNPPHYLVLEPEDTSERTGNLQQTNTNGYVFQHEANADRIALYEQAVEEVNSWGDNTYSTSIEYQRKLKSLIGKYPYRLDTNYAKIDRIAHEGIEAFKEEILQTPIKGKTIQEWRRISSYDVNDPRLVEAISVLLNS